MLNTMQKAYEEIINTDKQHSDTVIHFFLLCYYFLEVFNNYIQVFKNKCEDKGDIMTHEYLFDKFKYKYTNLVKERLCVKSKEEKY